MSSPAKPAAVLVGPADVQRPHRKPGNRRDRLDAAIFDAPADAKKSRLHKLIIMTALLPPFGAFAHCICCDAAYASGTAFLRRMPSLGVSSLDSGRLRVAVFFGESLRGGATPPGRTGLRKQRALQDHFDCDGRPQRRPCPFNTRWGKTSIAPSFVLRISQRRD